LEWRWLSWRVSLPKSGRLGVPFFAAGHMTEQALAGHTRESL
jgi:hypothetical protein